MKNSPEIRIANVSDAEGVSRLLKSAMLTYCADSGISALMLGIIVVAALIGLYSIL